MMRAHSSKIKSDIIAYEAHLKEYKAALGKAEFYLYATGTRRATASGSGWGVWSRKGYSCATRERKNSPSSAIPWETREQPAAKSWPRTR